LDPRVISAYLTQCTAEAQEGRILLSSWSLWLLRMSIHV
jgi:hypothetical protein